VLKIKSLFENYKNFPKVDCGYCGNPSCITMLRRACAGEVPLSGCLYFKAGIYNDDGFECRMDLPKSEPGPYVAFVNPCPTAPEQVTVEVNFSTREHAKSGFFDMVTLEKIFGQAIAGLRISPSLGLARLEVGGSSIMAFTEGRVLIRRAQDEGEAFWQLSRFLRQLWAAVN
jgi:ArsR family metal-binding transcriptional regulator